MITVSDFQFSPVPETFQKASTIFKQVARPEISFTIDGQADLVSLTSACIVFVASASTSSTVIQETDYRGSVGLLDLRLTGSAEVSLTRNGVIVTHS